MAKWITLEKGQDEGNCAFSLEYDSLTQRGGRVGSTSGRIGPGRRGFGMEAVRRRHRDRTPLNIEITVLESFARN